MILIDHQNQVIYFYRNLQQIPELSEIFRGITKTKPLLYQNAIGHFKTSVELQDLIIFQLLLFADKCHN